MKIESTKGHNGETIKIGDKVVSVKDPIQEPGIVTRITASGEIWTTTGRGESKDFKLSK